MRVFAAVVPPPQAHLDLDAFVAARRAVDSPWRWTPAHLWHITLAFMAEVPEESVDDVVEAMAEAADSTTPITLRLQGAGMFPEVPQARVLWMDVCSRNPRGLADLEQLALRTRTASSRIGVPAAGGDYRPHLTLARTRRPIEATRWLQDMRTYSGPDWLAEEITLFVSRDNRSGRPYYEPEARLPLRRR